jgi:tRNA/tmRNA/rRNA uracil-C5-methylase (TrmA/RlmC/RlmD family)
VSTIKTKDIESALLKKGFRRDYTHHEYLWLYVGGRKTNVRTRLSYGESEYGDSLLAQVKKQLGLSNKQQLLDLVKCPLSHAAYVAILQQSGAITIA